MNIAVGCGKNVNKYCKQTNTIIIKKNMRNYFNSFGCNKKNEKKINENENKIKAVK